MIIPPKNHQIGEKMLLIRCAEAGDAPILIDYLKVVCGETRFLMCEADEIHMVLPLE